VDLLQDAQHRFHVPDQFPEVHGLLVLVEGSEALLAFGQFIALGFQGFEFLSGDPLLGDVGGAVLEGKVQGSRSPGLGRAFPA